MSVLALVPDFPDVGGDAGDDEEEAGDEDGLEVAEPGEVAQGEDDDAGVDEGQSCDVLQFSAYGG